MKDAPSDDLQIRHASTLFAKLLILGQGEQNISLAQGERDSTVAVIVGHNEVLNLAPEDVRSLLMQSSRHASYLVSPQQSIPLFSLRPSPYSEQLLSDGELASSHGVKPEGVLAVPLCPILEHDSRSSWLRASQGASRWLYRVSAELSRFTSNE